ncbi:MAG: oligopeptide/dipeptide transporter, permease protein, partial [candidate division NC10 bacterium]|nr:oligopeptide/dipeptide transporter, permease protein [candidate division NC10 bacterium]
MATYLLRRLLQAVPVVLGVIFAVMLTIELIPGDPVTLMLGEHATQESVAAVRHALGLDKPLLVRYVQYIGNLLHGDLGRSLRERRQVSEELADVWPATLELTTAALFIAVICGVLAGVVS